MKPRTYRLFGAAIAIAVATTVTGGCGYKGDLVLPDAAETKAATAPTSPTPLPKSERETDTEAGTDATVDAVEQGAAEGAHDDGFERDGVEGGFEPDERDDRPE